MGALAMLFREQGATVSGSDMAFDPPMGPALRDAGITLREGYDASHIEPGMDLVVVGNAIRRDNPEAVQAEALGLRRASMSRTLREQFLATRRPLVVTGTHGKTTTSSMCAFILSKAELEPGYFIGGIPKNLPSGAAIGGQRRKLATSSGAVVPRPGQRPPFVVEGDEYDAVFWDKKPKFLDYVGVGNDDVVLLTSIEHDHVDIYATKEAYEAEFVKLLKVHPEGGLLVCDARDAVSRALVAEHCRSNVVYYALDGDDTGSVTPTWTAAMVPPTDTGMQPFDVFIGGMSCGRFELRVPGAHNVRNALGAMAAAAEGFGVAVSTARTAMAQFDGVKRRQDLVGSPDGVFLYDDFAHHPTAVDETLRALRSKHRGGKLFAVFEPRSATACRSVHQAQYVTAFGAADRVIFAPLGRSNIPEAERLDTSKLASDIGDKAKAAGSVDEIIEMLVADTQPGDVVALLSNGAFGGIYGKLTTRLSARAR
jgi:UDP-N-acetylmuramate: L-alanyl-gamma-D-glutamyl-meso-diaminopimelate ligase